MKAVLELKEASRVFRNGRGLMKTTLTVYEGEIIGLLGANGSGKTTLMKLACGLSRPDTGDVRIEGESVVLAPEKALACVGALIETPALYPLLSAKDNILTAMDYMGLKGRQCWKDALQGAGLKEVSKEKVKNFSLGMKQRLGLALAFLGDRKLLLLDEPTNGLDIESAARVKDRIKDACAKTGAAAIVSSHLAGEIERLATRVIIIHDGVVLKDVPMDKALEGGRTLEDFYLSVRKGDEA